MANQKHSSVATYIIVALILGVITYIEFAIVEYPQEWLGRNWTLFWLVALSVVKFIMMIMFFMYLKDDDRTYTGFFSSGIFISMATFVALTAMFILPRSVASTRPDNVVAGAASHEVPQDVLDLVETSGLSRSPAAQADSPRPADRSVQITPPLAGNDASSYEVTVPSGAPAQASGEAGASGDATAAAAAGSDQTPNEEQASEQAAGGTTAEAPAATAASWDAEAGASVYTANCVACHQGNGQGIPGAFPPLADHATAVYEAGGREFLMDVVLFGMQGQIQVNGMAYNGLMPAWGHLSDADVANVLNHIVTAWDGPPAGFAPYQADEVAAQRGLGLSAAEVHAMRADLGL